MNSLQHIRYFQYADRKKRSAELNETNMSTLE